MLDDRRRSLARACPQSRTPQSKITNALEEPNLSDGRDLDRDVRTRFEEHKDASVTAGAETADYGEWPVENGHPGESCGSMAPNGIQIFR